MASQPERTYGAGEFAALAGVTVRALHHYDRLGLLKPRRTRAGYRVYRSSDLERLEQIVALKFIGLPLKTIAALLGRRPTRLPDALRLQRLALEEKRRRLDAAIEAIRWAEQMTPAAGADVDAVRLTRIIEVIAMQDEHEWWAKYYTQEGRIKVLARGREWTPELQAQAEKQWTDLFKEVEAILDEDPAGEAAQSLAARWRALVESFTGGDPDLTRGAAAFYQDSPNWSAEINERLAPFRKPQVWEFMSRALAVRRAN